MSRISLLAAGAAASVLLGGSLAAPSGPVTLSASVTPSNTEVGRRIVYELRAVYPEGAELTWPSLGEGLQEFQIQDFRFLEETREGEGRSGSGVQYELNTFVSGEYVLPGMSVKYRLPSGEEGEVSSSRLFVTVRSPEVRPEDELRDIQGPIGLKQRFPWRIAAAAGAGVFLFAFLLYLRRRRTVKESPEAGTPPWEKALTVLKSLDPDGAMKNGEWKALYVTLSWVFREYLEERYEIPALEETTWEIERNLAGLGLNEPLQRQAVSVLNACDRVKYAKFTPRREEGVELRQELTDWIEATVPAQAEDDPAGETR